MVICGILHMLAIYEHTVKHFDQQLLNQYKEKDYAIQEIVFKTDVEKNTFHDRITKIEAEGLLRNRTYFAFLDDKAECIYLRPSRMTQKTVSQT